MKSGPTEAKPSTMSNTSTTWYNVSKSPDCRLPVSPLPMSHYYCVSISTKKKKKRDHPVRIGGEHEADCGLLNPSLSVANHSMSLSAQLKE